MKKKKKKNGMTWEKFTHLVVLLILFVMFFMIGIKYPLWKLGGETNDYEIIYDENLTQAQINISQNLIDSLDPLYEKKLKEIIFTLDMNKYMSPLSRASCTKLYGRPNRCAGSSDERGNLLVKYYYNTKTILCHEILHQWIPTRSNDMNKDPAHKMIDEMAKRGVCYKE